MHFEEPEVSDIHATPKECCTVHFSGKEFGPCALGLLKNLKLQQEMVTMDLADTNKSRVASKF